MANDLDFSHNVAAPQPGQPLPSYQRKEQVAVTPNPDLQSSISNYGASTNWMSQIGSAVAARASTAIATKMGTELGKTPQGDLGIPLTNFDETMQKSYQTQAHATLGMQASALINKSNLEMAQATRITPGLIQKTNHSISIGLQNIFKNAPNEIRPELEYQYQNVQQDQIQRLTTRMVSEQKEDHYNNIVNSSAINAQNINSLASRGNIKAAESLVESTRKTNEAGVATRTISPQAARSNVETAQISLETGKAISGYESAKANKKGEEYLTQRAEKEKEADPNYIAANANLMSYVGHQNQMRSQEEQLKFSSFTETIAKNPNDPSVSGQIQALSDLSPELGEKAKIQYIQYKKAFDKENADHTELLGNWGNSEAQARAGEKQQTKTFYALVDNVAAKQSISRDEAEVQVAASAGAPVSTFIKTLNNKATSGNPVNIDSAVKQRQSLLDMEAGHALIGISSKADAIMTQFTHQRGSMPDSDLARKITDNLTNITPDVMKTIDNEWALKLTAKGAGGLGASSSLADFAINAVRLKDNFGGGYFKTIYGNDIYDVFHSNFIAARGDYDTALENTKNYVNQTYGETYINGSTQITDRPIERTLGYKDPDVVPFIQQDFANQLAPKLKALKESTGEDWSINPITSPKTNPAIPFARKTFAPITLTRTDKSGKQYTYPVSLIGRPGNEWDIVLNTPNGNHNIFLVAPHAGVQTYKPNAALIHLNYIRHINGR